MLDQYNTRGLRRLVPGRESVILRVRTAEATFTDYTVADAKLLPRRKDADRASAQLRQDEGEWLLWDEPLDAAGVPEASPKVGDIILRTATSVSYLIESVQTDNLFNNERLCQTRKVQTGTG